MKLLYPNNKKELNLSLVKVLRYLGIYTLIAACTFFSFLPAQEENKSSEETVYISPIHSLTSANPPKSFVWVHGTVISAEDTDAFILKDATGEILLFLPKDELIALNITEGRELFVLGKVDISPVTPSKNELYAERILFADIKKEKLPSQ
jgi:uncharacterized protein YdeI (BOF family)